MDGKKGEALDENLASPDRTSPLAYLCLLQLYSHASSVRRIPLTHWTSISSPWHLRASTKLVLCGIRMCILRLLAVGQNYRHEQQLAQETYQDPC